jgi:cell division protease FtsH
MLIDAWLPIGFVLPDGVRIQMAIYEGANWQIYETQGDGRVLVSRESLPQHWLKSELLEQGALRSFQFGSETLYAFSSGSRHVLTPILECKSPANKSEALIFAEALRATRAVDPEAPLHDAIYAERLSRLLPT